MKETDNNVKLIVLDRLEALRAKPGNEHVLDGLVMDLLRVLTAPDMEVRRKCLHTALALVNSRNVEDVVGTLKKQLVKTLEADYDKVGLLQNRLIPVNFLHCRTWNIASCSSNQSTFVPSSSPKSRHLLSTL